MDWVEFFHDEGAAELKNVDAFMEELWVRFENPLQTHRGEAEIWIIRQGARPVAKYIQELLGLVGKMSWARVIAGLPVLRWAELGTVPKLPAPRNSRRASRIVPTSDYSRAGSSGVHVACRIREPTQEEPREMLAGMEDPGNPLLDLEGEHTVPSKSLFLMWEEGPLVRDLPSATTGGSPESQAYQRPRRC